MDEDSPRTGPRRVTGDGPPVDDEGFPSAPPMPSFASLRDTRRRSPVDLLLAPQDPAVEAVPPARPARPAGAPRPAEWADLWHIGVRLARWCVRQPLSTARRLLG